MGQFVELKPVSEPPDDNRDVLVVIQLPGDLPPIGMIGYYGSLGPNWAIYHDQSNRIVVDMWEAVPERLIVGWKELSDE